MYCVNCGVELNDGEKSCPLCGTTVYRPDLPADDGERTYPPVEPAEEFNRNGILFILSFMFGLPLLLTVICDLSIVSRITWSGYVACAILLGYVIIVLPLWFRMPNPVIFVSADFAGVALMLLYINNHSGGNWFLTFALPVTAFVMLLSVAVITLTKYLPKSAALFVFGGALILSGAAMPFLELLLNINFAAADSFVWSFYPLAVLSVLGLMLIIIGVCPSIKESLRKKFFIS